MAEAVKKEEVKPKKKISFTKWFALGLGGLIGISHIGMIGSLSNRESNSSSTCTDNKIRASTNGYITW